MKVKLSLLNEQYLHHNYTILKSNNQNLYLSDNRLVVDFCMGAGALVFGHNPNFLENILKQQISKGLLYVAPNQNAIIASNFLVNTLKNVHKVIFSNSGSEATMRALRIARTATGKNEVLFFSGFWHGTHDQVLFDSSTNNEGRNIRMPYSEGIPEGCYSNNVLFEKNNLAVLEYIQHRKNHIAAIIIEPIQGSNPSSHSIPYYKKVIEVAKSNNILIILDEIITGFRLKYGGAAELFNLDFDIVCFGKTISHGISVGVTCINEETYSKIKDRKVVYGGTFSANPFVTCAINSSIQKYFSEKASIYPTLNKKGEKFRKKLNSFFLKNNYNLQIIGTGSISRIIFSREIILSKKERDFHEKNTLEKQKKFYDYLFKNGCYISTNRIILFSLSHTKENISHLIEVIKQATKLYL